MNVPQSVVGLVNVWRSVVATHVLEHGLPVDTMRCVVSSRHDRWWSSGVVLPVIHRGNDVFWGVQEVGGHVQGIGV